MVQKLFDLNQGWLLIDGNVQDDPSFHTAGIPTDNALQVSLPCFTHMHIPNHVGVSWFEKRFTLPCLPEANEVALLTFHQATFRAEVSVNGVILGVHLDGEDAFSFNIAKLLTAGENRITVRVSKPHDIDVDGFTFAEIPTRNQTTRGLTPGSCYNVSGLCGEASLRILPAVYVEDLHLSPVVETGVIRIFTTVASALDADAPITLHMEARRAPDGELEASADVHATVHPGENELAAELSIPSPRLWDVDEPNLYAVSVVLVSSAGRHSTAKKTGFRTFRVREDGYFELNGRRILPRCSHSGNAMPETTLNHCRDPKMMRRDFLMAKAAGFNMLRFISGAPLPMQLDLCDEIGLMIYEEPMAGWMTYNGPHAAELYRHNMLSIVKRDRSHPCVTIWGLLNEHRSTPPYDQVLPAAIGILPDLRELDETRLVLLSSGRWDLRGDIGTVANPGSRVWQCLWGNEGNPDYVPGNDLGDIHFYPESVPLRPQHCKRMRTFGHDGNKPVFVSESGVGSILDTVSAVRYFDREQYISFAPDLQMYRQMNDLFMADLARYGFDQLFPAELVRTSMLNHAYYREQAFDQLRANPMVCGISLTGLLDHSICGEGLWTIYRTYKPMMADVLQDGFAPLRWCVFPQAPAVFEGSALTVEGLLATEDILLPGKEYHVRAGIVCPDGSVIGMREYTIVPTAEQVRHMVVPVIHESWSLTGLPCGEYRFRIELLNGGLATCGVKTFHILPKARAAARRKICTVNLSEQQTVLLRHLGYEPLSLAQYTPECVILTGELREDDVQALAPMLASGAHIVAGCAAFANDHAHELLPEARRPVVNRDREWLYHRETALRPGGRFFKGMRTGPIDALLYTGLITGTHLTARGPQIPDETDAIAYEPGHINRDGYMGGFKLGSYNVGKGLLILNTFDLLDSAAEVPYAAQLLVNLLDNA